MEFRLRPMEQKDLMITLEMRNDSTVLKTAITPNEISYKEHEAMFKFNNAIKLVFEVDNILVGYVQVSRDPDKVSGEWSFHMEKKQRGKGLSSIMLNAALYYLVTVEGYKSIISKVKTDNIISKHLHYKLGFEYDGEINDGMYNYKKKL
jgi:RimJ/RimL family protein N-acetyltransferase